MSETNENTSHSEIARSRARATMPPLPPLRPMTPAELARLHTWERQHEHIEETIARQVAEDEEAARRNRERDGEKQDQ